MERERERERVRIGFKLSDVTPLNHLINCKF